MCSLRGKLGQSATYRRRTAMNFQSLIFIGFSGATRRIRTDDLLITNKPADHNRTHQEAKLPAKWAILVGPFSVLMRLIMVFSMWLWHHDGTKL